MNEKIKNIGLAFVNAFLVRAKDGFVLIDTGLAQQWKKLESELLSAGCLPDNLKLVIITHCDLDHAGNCATLQEKYNAKIAMHQGDSFMAEKGEFLKRTTRTLSAKILNIFAPLLNPRAAFPAFKPDIFLTDGQRLDGYGLDATIIHIPGHTKGSIAVATDDGDIFVGDTIVNSIKPDYATFIDDFQELKNSIGKLRKLNGKKIYSGHGKPFPMDRFLKIDI